MQHASPYFKKHWKLALHLIFKTKRFGVNNKWWETFDSQWGLPAYKIIINAILIIPLVESYRAMKNRMDISIGFVPEEEFYKVFRASTNTNTKINK